MVRRSRGRKLTALQYTPMMAAMANPVGAILGVGVAEYIASNWYLRKARDELNKVLQQESRAAIRDVIKPARKGAMKAIGYGQKPEDQKLAEAHRAEVKRLSDSGVSWFFNAEMSEPLRASIRYSRKPGLKILSLAERGLQHKKCKKRPHLKIRERRKEPQKRVRRRKKKLSTREQALMNLYGKH